MGSLLNWNEYQLEFEGELSHKYGTQLAKLRAVVSKYAVTAAEAKETS